MTYPFEFPAPLAYRPDFLSGAWTALTLSLAAAFFGSLLGVLCALAKTGRSQTPADIVATSLAIVGTVLQKSPKKDLVTKFTMSTGPLGIGMRKREPELEAWINDWITANTANGKSTAIHKKYHGS